MPLERFENHRRIGTHQKTNIHPAIQKKKPIHAKRLITLDLALHATRAQPISGTKMRKSVAKKERSNSIIQSTPSRAKPIVPPIYSVPKPNLQFRSPSSQYREFNSSTAGPELLLRGVRHRVSVGE